MGRLRVVVAVAALAVLTASLIVPLASAGSPPLAEAGLDQQVVRGATVYLDAGGSSDPDGTVQRFSWTVTRPDGTTTTPDCRTCERTRFRPTQTGEYAVEVTVTGSDGEIANDTLYVTVVEPTDATVEITGPVRVPPDTAITYTAQMRTDGTLQRFTWTQNGSRVAGQRVTGSNATVTLDRTFDETGRYHLRGTVRTRQGTRGSDNLSVVVADPEDGNGGTGEVCPNGYPIHNGPNGQLSGCRQSALETVNDQLLPIPSANPNAVVFESDSGERYRMNHKRLMTQFNVNPNSGHVPKNIIIKHGIKVDLGPEKYNEEYPDEAEDRPGRQGKGSNSDSGSNGVNSNGECYAPCGAMT